MANAVCTSRMCNEIQERDYRELREAIEYMIAKQSKLLATLERKQKLLSGSLEEIEQRHGWHGK